MNKTSVWSGSPDSPLAPEGHEQAIKAGKYAHSQELKFDLIISSPSQRALNTAKYVAREVGYPIDKIELDETIKERNFGDLEGRRDLVAATKYMVHESAIDSFKGVESLAELQARADAFLDRIKSRDEDIILIAGHGAFGRALYRKIHNKPINYRLKIYQNAKMERLI